MEKGSNFFSGGRLAKTHTIKKTICSVIDECMNEMSVLPYNNPPYSTVAISICFNTNLY